MVKSETKLAKKSKIDTTTQPEICEVTAYTGKPSNVLDIFPAPFQKFFTEASRAKSVPVDLVIDTTLSVASCAVMTKRALKVKNDWLEHGNTWSLILGDQDSGKSRIARFCFDQIIQTDKKLLEKFINALENYKVALKSLKKGIKLPPKPQLKQLVTFRSTLLGMARTASENNSSVFILSSEFGETIEKLHKYDQEQKAVFLDAYSTSYFKSGVSNKPVLGTDIISGMCGATTEHNFLKVVRQEDMHGGFMTRTMFYLHHEEDNPPLDMNFSISQASKSLYTRVITNLLRFEWKDNGDGTHSPVEVPWSQVAKAIYDKWVKKKEDEKNRGEFRYTARFGRFVGSMTLRTILLLHCLKAAALGKEGTEPITVETVEGAIKYMEDRNLMQIRVWDMVSEHLKSTQGSKYEVYRGKVVDALEVHADLIKQKNGKLTNDEVFGIISPHIPSLSPVSLGRLLKGLGYANWRTATQRGFVIPVNTTTPSTETDKKAA